MLDHVPTDNHIELIPGQRVRFKIPLNLLLEHRIPSQLFGGNVYPHRLHSGCKIEITGRSASRLQQVDAALPLEESIDGLRDFRPEDCSHRTIAKKRCRRGASPQIRITQVRRLRSNRVSIEL